MPAGAIRPCSPATMRTSNSKAALGTCAWHLYYQGIRSEPLVSFAAAQQSAPAFARAVLAQLASLIVD